MARQHSEQHPTEEVVITTGRGRHFATYKAGVEVDSLRVREQHDPHNLNCGCNYCKTYGHPDTRNGGTK